MTVLLCGSSQTQLGTEMPSRGGHIIKALVSAYCERAVKIGSEADLVQHKLPSAIYWQLVQAVADGDTVFFHDGISCQYVTRPTRLKLSETRFGLTRGPPKPRRRARAASPLHAMLIAGTAKGLPILLRMAEGWNWSCSFAGVLYVARQDICGAISTERNPAVCEAYLPSARTVPAPRPCTR